ncbi:MAG TPA: tetratricopeptide repeat protein [Candidatus Deferrimicrobiaceae bacterium]|nr:tetratricopeptide repeat protein [Candidatus Deferrimicrobiaceae bacterium]
MKSDLTTLITIGKRAFEEKDFQRAENLLREAMSGGANYSDIHHMLGLIYHHWGKFEEAVREFEISLSRNPEYAEALTSLAITLNELGRYEEAKDAHQRAARSLLKPGRTTSGSPFASKIANLHAELGELYLALGNTEEAVAEYRKALQIAPRFPDLRVRLAIALREAGRLEEGLAELDRAMDDRPELVSALAQQGVLLYLLGRKGEARRAWENALFQDPQNRLVQLYLNTLDRDAGSG